MTDRDFIVYNMPAMLGREVRKRNEGNELVRDDSWYASVREKFFNLFLFFQDHGLSKQALVCELADVDKVTLRMSDLTELGRRLVMSQAPDKWLGSFDRPGSKKLPTDVRSLEKALNALKEK